MVVERARSRGRRDAGRPRPTKVIAIACNPRSGSTLVAAAFDATGVAGHCDEVLNNHVVFGGTWASGHRVAWAQLRLSNLLHRVRTRQLRNDPWVSRRLVLQHLDRYGRRVMSADGLLVIKLFWTLYRVNMLEHGLDVHVWGVPVVWVRLVRHDRVAQAVSHVRARQTDQWLWNQTAVGPIAYDAEAITRELRSIDRNERAWDDYFRRTGESPLLVAYEDLDHHYETTMRAIFDHVGLTDVPVPPQQLRRQRDDDSDGWIHRYLDEHPATAATD